MSSDKDQFIADLVAEHSLPLEKYLAKAERPSEAAPRVSENESLSTLIQLSIDDDTPIVVVDDGVEVGVITRPDILQTVIEGAETS